MLLYIFAAVYIIVDIIYVMISNKTYMRVFENIQNAKTKMTSSRIAAAIAAYTCMAIGWVFLVAPLIEYNKKVLKQSAFWAGAVPGFVFGFVLYGVYNFTNYVTFNNYTPAILARDLAWGSTWVTVVSIAYSYSLS